MRLFILVILPLVLFSCAEQEPETMSYTILTGQVSPDTDEIYKQIPGGFEKLAFDSEGNFSDTLDISSPVFISLYAGDKVGNVFLQPGNTVRLDATGEEIIYSGDNITENQYLNASNEIKELATDDFERVYSQKEGDFIAYMDSIKSVLQEQLSENTELDNDFRPFAKKAIDYWTGFKLIQYQTYHRYFADDYEPSGMITQHIGEVDLDNEAEAATYGDYVALASVKLEAKAESIEDTTLTQLDRQLRVLEGMNSPTILHNQLKEALYYFNANSENMDGLKARMLALAKLDKTKEAIEERYAVMSKLHFSDF